MIMLLVLHTILVRSTFHQNLIKIFQKIQACWKGQGRVMDRWVDELIDRWAHGVHFHIHYPNCSCDKKDTLKLSKRYLIFCISKQYHHTIVNLLHQKSPMGIIKEKASS